MSERSLNAVYSKRTMRRRYEVWFLRFLLADGSGAWWFRYPLMNLGRAEGGCPGNSLGMPAQVWATWFPRDAKPLSFIQGFSKEQLALSGPGTALDLEIAGNRIAEDCCAGQLEVENHTVVWDLRYRSTAAFTLSDKGWIGFSRTPHSDAVFAGEIAFDGHRWRGDPLGYGVQEHNCGYWHRHFWTWAHCIVPDSSGGISTFEALEHEMPLGLRFRKALFWHEGKAYRFSRLKSIERSREPLRWTLHCSRREDRATLVAILDGSGTSTHRLPYLKTNCSGSFEVTNNSLSAANLYFRRPGQPVIELRTDGGVVLEMVGE